MKLTRMSLWTGACENFYAVTTHSRDFRETVSEWVYNLNIPPLL